MTAPAVVGGDGDRGVGRGHGPPGVGGDERLVTEPDDDRGRVELAGRVDATPQ